MKHRVAFCGFASPTVFYIACNRNGVEYIPGQCITITHPDNSSSSGVYNIASSPRNNKHLEFYIKIFENEKGGVSKALSNVVIGNEIELSEPHGDFTPGKDCEDQKYVYIATGAGISPFLSALGYYSHNPLMILHGGKTQADCIEGWRLKTDYNCKFAVSQEETRFPKKITEWFSELPTNDSKIKYYICGADSMIIDNVQYLSDHGVTYDKIQTEYYHATR